MHEPVGYPPFDVPKPVDDGLWIVDAAPIRAGGLPLPLRMTVIRFLDGGLLLCSPTRHTPDLQRALETLGPIRHLVAPNVGHWMFLRDWQRACPEAVTWAAPGLRDRAQVRVSGLRIDHDLGPVAPAVWRDEVEQVLVQAPLFAEVVLFHRASRTLIVTDLVLNLEGQGLPPLRRALAGGLGILAPEGQAPLYLRLILKLNGAAVGHAAERLVALAPRRVIMGHGRPFTSDAAARLRRSLRDLLDGAAGSSRRASVASQAALVVGSGLLLGFGVAALRRRRAARGVDRSST